MAKEKNKDGEAQDQQLQQPEPPPKKNKGLSLPLIIGISFGALLILIGGTLGAVYIMVNNMTQNTNTEQVSESHDSDYEEENNEDENFNLEAKYSELQKVVEKQTKHVHFFELGEIITNPKSSDKFVVIDIGVEYVAYNEDGEVVEILEEEESSHQLFDKRELAKVRSKVNELIWGFNEDELQNKRSELPKILKDDFKEIFLDNKAIIKDVVILRLIIQ